MRSYLDLLSLANSSEQISASVASPPASAPPALPPAVAVDPSDGAAALADDSETLTAPEADDDPYRLARVNLDRYREGSGGRTLRFWRGEWYAWRKNCYRRLDEKEFRAKLGLGIKHEFDRLAIERLVDGEANPDEPVYAKKVTPAVVSSVLQATASLTVLPASVEFGTWLADRSRPNIIAAENGLLDVDAALAGADEKDCVRPHSPDWFSVVSLPYRFDFAAGAAPPKWLAYLDKVMAGDAERIALLQEWAGYLILPDTGQQRFLVLEGDGANGKSVYMAAITAMLGAENVSTVPLEIFGAPFDRTETLGKLVNICGDAGEIDKPAEGYVKSFTSGDRMLFQRKGLTGITCLPTARLMLACNNRPRFSDRSDGVWRRMLLVPFQVQIQEHERVYGMDRYTWWEQSGELPQIFNWALVGLARLREQRTFTEPAVCRLAKLDYRDEMNPARAFLEEVLRQSDTGAVPVTGLYSAYKKWIGEHGHKPLAERTFGREVFRLFRGASRQRIGSKDERAYVYTGIEWAVTQVCGVEVDSISSF